jgi:hypothetical protein
MAVLLEAISVVIRRQAVVDRFPGGWTAFVDAAPNGTLCADDHLVRLGFMAPPEVEDFVTGLEPHGIQFVADGSLKDIAVIDQQRGPLVACDWLEFGRITLPTGPTHIIGACRLVGDEGTSLSVPPDWTYEGSPTEMFGLDPQANPDATSATAQTDSRQRP